jgi:flagellar FliL protein
MRRLLPLVLALVGLGAGAAAGLALRPAPAPDAASCVPAATDPHQTVIHDTPPVLEHDYVKLSNQFVVPVVRDDKVKALVVLTLSLEIAKGKSEEVFAREPKLRDAFLRAMFDHANSGGFDGDFTANGNMAHLREALVDAGKGILGEVMSDVLITDIARQDG